MYSFILLLTFLTLALALPTPQLRPPMYKGGPGGRRPGPPGPFKRSSSPPSPSLNKRSDGSLAPLLKRQSGTRTNGAFIVSLVPDSVDPLNRGEWIQEVLGREDTIEDGPNWRLTWPPSLFDGLSGVFTQAELEVLRANEAVAWIQEDITMYTNAIVQQLNAPWGVARLSAPGPFTGGSPFDLAFPYTFDDSAGQGTTAYVIDTGIRTTHEDFGGRAQVIATFGSGQPGTDINGHGTHVAGTIGGAVFGVAKRATIKAVKTMADDGSGNTSDIMSGIIFAAQDAAESGGPAVISMSIGGAANQAIDEVITRVIASGIPVVVAAGNEGVDANNVSPARLPQVISVGSTDINDVMSPFSNFGTRVDILAPGTDILSCGVDADDAVATLSGTSMATPHITGLSLLIMGQEGGMAPDVLKNRLLALGRENIVTGLRGGTRNELANNGAQV